MKIRWILRICIVLVIVETIVCLMFSQIKEENKYIVEVKTEVGSLEENFEETDQTEEKININIADEKELDKLPGIGEKKAKRIIKYREENGGFKVIEDIMKVNGISRKMFDEFKNEIKVE